MTANVIRKSLIVGNWKMNKTATEAVDLAQEIVEAVGRQTDVNVVLCPPFTALSSVAKAVEGSNVSLGAQNLYPAKSGAFTGEISPDMLRQLLVTYVILGHSERRTIFKESNAFVNLKVHAALENGLRPILCVGETLEEHDAGRKVEVIQQQLEECLEGITVSKPDSLVIAYEPVWAIGTGKNATPAIAQEVHQMIRLWLVKRFSKDYAARIRIVYGGSLKPDNANELLTQPDVDGGLIGGAALESRSFIKIVESALRLTA